MTVKMETFKRLVFFFFFFLCHVKKKHGGMWWSGPISLEVDSLGFYLLELPPGHYLKVDLDVINSREAREFLNMDLLQTKAQEGWQ